MNIVLDILLALVLGGLIWTGWHRGFFKSVLSLGRLALTVILTIIFGPRVAALLDEKLIHPPIFDSVHAKLAEMAAKAGESTSSFFSSLSDKFGSVVDPSTFENQSAATNEQMNAMVEKYSQSISSKISLVVATIIGYVVLFLVCFLILSLLIWILGKLTKLPLIRKVDKVLGLLLGIVSGYLVVSLLAVLIYMILVATGSIDAYTTSHVFKFFYDFNVFKTIVPKIF